MAAQPDSRDMFPIPPHCTNPRCTCHRTPIRAVWYKKAGSYRTQIQGVIPRFRCRFCGRTFSPQSFHISYWSRSRPDLTAIMYRICNGGGIRKTAQELKLHPNTLANWIARIGRKAVCIHMRTINHIHMAEHLVFDGFETFTHSKYFPGHLTLLCGKTSQFLYLIDYALMHRKGAMTPHQKKKNQHLVREFPFPPETIIRSIASMADRVNTLFEHGLMDHIEYTSDEHPHYRIGFGKNEVARSRQENGVYTHRTVSSRAARTLRNPLFSVNYADRLLRKDLASQARGSSQIARNINHQMYRFAIYQFEHNYLKPYRIKRCPVDPQTRAKKTHAMMIGVSARPELDPAGPEFHSREWITRMQNADLHPCDMKTFLGSRFTPGLQTCATVPAHVAGNSNRGIRIPSGGI